MMSYEELRARIDAPAGSSWGLWDNDLGTLNFLTDDVVLAAVRTVRTGRRINLDRVYPTVEPSKASGEPRSAAAHHVFVQVGPFVDDYLDGFYLQGRTQVDALRHAQHSVHGFYNGVSEDNIVANNPRLGIGNVAEAGGVVGRGVLLDVAGHSTGASEWSYDPRALMPITVSMLEEVAASQKVTFASGDILLVRTGGSPDGGTPGLEQSEEMLAWLWDHQFSALASDNLAVEMFPVADDSPFKVDGDEPLIVGMAHPWLIGLLGFTLCEQLLLDELAEESRADGRYECLFVAQPLNVVGGVGSPANAVALR
jgi:kynurenine formamidase